MTWKILLVTRRKLLDGTYPLKLRITSGNVPKDYPIGSPMGVYLTEAQWDANTLSVRQIENVTVLNLEILRIRNEVEKIFLQKQWVTDEEVRKIVRLKKKGVGTISSFVDEMVIKIDANEIVNGKTKKKLSENYKNNLKSGIRKFKEFVDTLGALPFEAVNESFFDKFVKHLRDVDGAEHNTISKRIDHAFKVIDEARKGGLHDNSFSDYNVPPVKVKKIKLTEKEVESMSSIDLSEFPDLQAEQERFQVAYNFLLRFSDSITIEEHEAVVMDGIRYLKKDTQKTGAEVMIPIQEKVYEILKRRNFKMKGKNKDSNSNLKKIGELCGINEMVFFKGKPRKKYELIETHTTRRSRATHLYNSGMNPELLMTLGGWKTKEQMMHYIDVDIEVKAREAARHPGFK